jgi:hypothetical protein
MPVPRWAVEGKGRVWVCALAASVLMSSCSSGTRTASPAAPTTIEPSARVLVVTHTEGFRHSSIPIAEATIAEIGRQ